jgi:hypothetical protein
VEVAGSNPVPPTIKELNPLKRGFFMTVLGDVVDYVDLLIPDNSFSVFSL